MAERNNELTAREQSLIDAEVAAKKNLQDEEDELRALQLRPFQYLLQFGDCLFSMQLTPEDQIQYENQLVNSPSLISDFIIKLQYQGPQLQPAHEEQLVTKITGHLLNAYKEAAEKLGIDVTETSAGLSLQKNGQALSFTDRLDLENTMQECFNKNAANDGLIMVRNDMIPALKTCIELEQEHALNTKPEDRNTLTPFRTRFTL